MFEYDTHLGWSKKVNIIEKYFVHRLQSICAECCETYLLDLLPYFIGYLAWHCQTDEAGRSHSTAIVTDIRKVPMDCARAGWEKTLLLVTNVC